MKVQSKRRIYYNFPADHKDLHRIPYVKLIQIYDVGRHLN